MRIVEGCRIALFYIRPHFIRNLGSDYPKIKNNLRTMTRLDARTQKISRVGNRSNQLKLDKQMNIE